MADNVPNLAKPTPPQGGNSELDDLAFRIYSQQIAVSGVRFNGEREAIDSYRRAQSFLDARGKVKSGALSIKPPSGPQLCDCSAPNLEPTHPHNLVSQRFGDLEKVNRIKKWLDANPTPEDSSELVSKINKDFKELRLNWDMPMVNTARAVFPAYCEAK